MPAGPCLLCKTTKDPCFPWPKDYCFKKKHEQSERDLATLDIIVDEQSWFPKLSQLARPLISLNRAQKMKISRTQQVQQNTYYGGTKFTRLSYYLGTNVFQEKYNHHKSRVNGFLLYPNLSAKILCLWVSASGITTTKAKLLLHYAPSASKGYVKKTHTAVPTSLTSNKAASLHQRSP